VAAAFTISCPECDKQIKAPPELQGKKIRCKGCGHTFVVKAPPAKKPAPDPRAAKAKAASRPPADEYENPNPYDVTSLDLTPRCPHCAADLESEDTVICVNCGYDLEHRVHLETKKTVEASGMDQFLWLLPGILCVLSIFLMLGWDVFHVFWLPGLIEDEWYWFLGHAGVQVWVVVASLFGIFYAARFAIQRLILDPTAPEKELK